MKSTKQVFVVMACVAGALFTAQAQSQSQSQPIPVTSAATATPLRWVVNMGAGGQISSLQATQMTQQIQTALGVPVSMVRPLLQPNSYLLEMQSWPVLGSLQTPQAIAAALKALPGVRFASPDIQLNRTAVPAPNDSAYAANQSVYMNSGAYASLRMQEVWEQTRGSSNVVIAVLDSGVLFDNPELKGRLLPGYDFVSEATPPTGMRETGTVRNTGSNDGDGRDADPSDPGDAPPTGFNCPDTSTTSSWHGTTVASVAAAQSNNGQFLTGMDWNAKVLPVRVSGRCGIATLSDIVDAFYWATGSGRVDPVIGVNPNPANVINLSFASDTPLLGGGCTADDPVALAVADARARNVSVVVSAGNNSGGAVQYPANCAGTIAAGAAEQDGQLATYTAKGGSSGFLTLHAPGNANGLYVGASNTGESAPNPNGSNAVLVAGTSFSSPMVAGAIALFRAARPSLTVSEIENLLRNSALPYPPNADFAQGLLGGLTRRNCTSTACGAGLLNVFGALEGARALPNALPVANVQQSAVVASNGPFVLDGSLSTNSSLTGSNLTFSWQQVFGNPVALSGTTTDALLVESGMAGNIAEFALTVTDTTTNRSNTSVVRLANVSVDERTFRASGSSGSSSMSSGSGGEGTPVTSTPVASSGSGGGGGGALGIFGLLGMLTLIGVWRRLGGVA